MIGIKKHLSKLGNWNGELKTIIKAKAKPNQTKTKNIAETMVLASFWATVTCLGIKKHVVELGISMVASDRYWNQSKTKPNQTKTKNIAKTMVLANFQPTVTCLVSKSMYSL